MTQEMNGWMNAQEWCKQAQNRPAMGILQGLRWRWAHAVSLTRTPQTHCGSIASVELSGVRSPSCHNLHSFLALNTHFA